MNSEEKRMKIIETGAALIHEKGFNDTGLKEILDIVGIPKGSFYYFFNSKTDFGLQVIEHFSGFFSGMAKKMLRTGEGSILERMESLFIFFEEYFENRNFTGGCPIGNLAQEMGCHDDQFAERLDLIFANMSNGIYHFLLEAEKAGEISQDKVSRDMSDFILNSWEGTIMRMKVQRNLDLLQSWRKYICRKLLPVNNS